MTLAVMLSTDRDAFICDMAETYHILDVWALPVYTLAVLASGLREDSRIRMKMSGMRYVPMELLAARCADTLAFILHVLGSKEGTDPPVSILDDIFGRLPEKETVGFSSAAEFEAERRRLLEAINNGG